MKHHLVLGACWFLFDRPWFGTTYYRESAHSRSDLQGLRGGRAA